MEGRWEKGEDLLSVGSISEFDQVHAEACECLRSADGFVLVAYRDRGGTIELNSFSGRSGPVPDDFWDGYLAEARDLVDLEAEV